MKRPPNLPEFSDPPINEVVLGVQFAPPPDQKTSDAFEVWNLFRLELPKIQEQPPLPPQFETFGSMPSQQGINIQFGTGSAPGRFWFISEDENHLVQFQTDRFLQNWRKRKDSDSYPRFEHIYASFRSKLESLRKFYEDQRDHRLEINQVEVTYINIIQVDGFEEFGNWFKIWSQPDFEIEHINVSFPQVIKDEDEKSIARLYHEVSSVIAKDGIGKAFRLNLTFRGKPYSSDVAAALEFISKGRTEIVRRFAEITTEKAHETWRRST